MSDKYVIKRAGPDAASDIRALTRRAYAPWVEVVGREPLPMTADYETAVRDHLIDLAYCDGELCGLVEMVSQPESLLIQNLAVSPDHQGQGLGTLLLHHAEKQAAQLGQSILRLYTNRDFGSNVSFYERSGFKVERTELFMGGWTVYMCKSVGE
ncbi:MAG: GNAT family N-acetyltransferase [Alphaproteobacteria bacterium]|nr:GNAT family N-acetyltransferase [Alphaproteobacteria bacterium]